MPEEIKPCPRCGGVIDVGNSGMEPYSWTYDCGQCAENTYFPTEGQAMAAANTRAEPDPLTAAESGELLDELHGRGQKALALWKRLLPGVIISNDPRHPNILLLYNGDLLEAKALLEEADAD